MRFRILVLPGLIAAAAAQMAMAQTPQRPAVPPGVTAEWDVEYSRVGQRVEMDIFRPAKMTDPLPAVLAVHGGGFRRGSRSSYHRLCMTMASRGYVCATASYRLAPRHQFPAPVEDVKAAVRFLRANAAKYGIDPARIGATGASAGGHLVLMLGLTGRLKVFEGTGPNRDYSSEVQAVVNYFGPVDLTESYGRSRDAGDVLPLFLGGDLSQNRKQHLVASPLFYVTPMAPPILTVHGTVDELVNYEHATWITSRLIDAGVDAELETMAGQGHGFKGEAAERAEARLIGFFDRHMKKVPQTRLILSDHGPRGEVVWLDWPSERVVHSVPNGRGHDVDPLPGGGLLYTFAPRKQVIELDATRREKWTCCDGLESPLSAQRLENGNTLIGDVRLARVIEVDRAGKTVWQYENPDMKKWQIRNVRRTAAGTTLIAIEGNSSLIEVDKGGKIVWQWQSAGKDARKLYQALRLVNGNTIISLSDPGEIVEVDRSGKIVRSIGGENMGLRMGWTSGFAMMPNGNLLVNDYTGRRLMEVDMTGKVIHEMRTGERTFASVAVAK